MVIFFPKKVLVKEKEKFYENLDNDHSSFTRVFVIMCRDA
jgi:hypothetical protein